MAIYASFIGVDKYDHPKVRDLNGAERDAIALHALFSDSVPNLNANLLLSYVATEAEIRGAISATLARAAADDIALLFFAGHGSPDHRLIARDSDPANHLATSVGMDEIAEGFRGTRARVAICILDCCFSGGAPARVLDDVPITRSAADPSALFTGKGRVLITASASDEAAYEHPKSRHGIFTMALMDSLQAAGENPCLMEVMSEVLARVRAEAARMGVHQTPVWLGAIEGGLRLPRIKAGSLFESAFPTAQTVKVGGAIGDLAQFGFSSLVLDKWQALFTNGLNALQADAVNEHGLLQGKSLLVVAPTSAGKTFIGELAATMAVAEGKKAVFLLPYKALVNEKFDQFSSLYGDLLGLRVVRCTGDYQDQTLELVKGKFDLALLTYEMFLNLIISNQHILNQLGLVVVDEAQFITDPSRGISIELLLTLLLTARSRGIEPQLICLSAVIGNINSFDDWLGAEKLISTSRPVDLEEGVIDRAGIYQYRNYKGEVREEQLLPFVVQRKEKPHAQDVIVPLVSRLVREGEQVIVFRNQRGSAEGCASYLANDLGLPSVLGVEGNLPENDLSQSSSELRYCLARGTAFHTTNLHRDERTAVERAFRDPASRLRVLAATTTVAAGVNTPASTVIIAEQEFKGEDGRDFTVAEYKNMAGRAGRLGYNEKGKCIIYAETPFNRDQLFRKYVLGSLEPITSSFDAREIDTWVLRLLAQVDLVPRTEVTSLLANTFGGFLMIKANPGSRDSLAERIECLLVRMIELRLVETEQDQVRLSLLGRACGRSALSFESALRLVELVRSLDPMHLTAETLLALIQALPEASGGHTPMMKKGQSEYVRPSQASGRFGSNVVTLLQRGAKDQMDYLARCKRVAILGDWIDGKPLEGIEKRYSPNPFRGVISAGNIRGFADSARLYYRAAFMIATLVHVVSALDVDEVEVLQKQLEFGIPKEATAILEYLASADRGTYLALNNSGLVTLHGVMATSEDDLTKIVGARLARILRVKGQESITVVGT